MTHFNHTRWIFLDRIEESWVLNNREKEYVPYDYDYEEDILPHLVNTYTDERVPAKRKLENIRTFNRNSLIGLVFRDFEFMDEDALNKIFGVTTNQEIDMVVFINCRFGGTVIDIPKTGIGFYDCVFDGRLELNVNYSDGINIAELRKCVINSQFNISSGAIVSDITIEDCIFNENSSLGAKYYRHCSKEDFSRLRIKNCIFKGDVNFESAYIPEYSVFEYLTFYREVNFNETKLGENIIFKNICFAPFANKVAKDGLRSFVKALNDNGYKKEAKFYETHYGDAEAKKVNKTEYDIAVESGWLNIKQAALFLGVKYSSLLDMRKDDKILGVQRIPFVGEGKNSRYYVPLLQAYKNKDMKKVAELEKEMHQKEKEI